MRTCSECGETKPLDEYHRNKNSRDGRRSRCKTCRRSEKREYYTANRETLLERRAEYYARPEIKARVAEYHAAHPHVSWVKGYQRRAKRYGFEPVVEPFTKDELVARWGDACAHCGGPFEQLDHFPVAVINGGTHTIENCRPSCAPCNAKGCVIRRTKTNETENTK